MGRCCRGSVAQILGETAVPRYRLGRTAQVLGESAVGRCCLGTTAQVLGESGMCRGLRCQTDFAGQCIHQFVHIIRFTACQQTVLLGQPHHLGIGVRVTACILRRFRPGRILRHGRFHRLLYGRCLYSGLCLGTARCLPGTHGIVSSHKILSAVHRGGIHGPQLHGEPGVDRLPTGQIDGFAYRFPGRRFRHSLCRRSLADLLARCKLHRITLFAVDGRSIACAGRRRTHGFFDAAQHLHRIPFRFRNRRRCHRCTGILAAPDIFHCIALRFFGFFYFRLGLTRCTVHHRRLFLPLFGNYDFFRDGITPAKQIPEQPFFSGGLRRYRLLFPIREILFLFLFKRGLFHGLVLLRNAAQGNIDRHKFIGILGRFQTEKTALLSARFPYFSIFIRNYRHRIPEKFLELIFSLIQRIGVGGIGIRCHFQQKALDDPRAGRISQCAGGIAGIFLRFSLRLRLGHRLHRGCLLGCRTHGLGRSFRIRGRLRRGCPGRLCRTRSRTAKVLKIFQIIQPRKRDTVILFRCSPQRRGRNPHTAQNLIHLMIRHRVLHTGSRLLLVKILQNAIHRIIGTFAWHV